MQAGIADDDLPLGQNPIGKPGVAAVIAVQRQAGNEDAAVGLATHAECRLVDFQPVQAQVEVEQGGPAEHGFDAFEAEGRAAGLVGHTQVV